MTSTVEEIRTRTGRLLLWSAADEEGARAECARLAAGAATAQRVVVGSARGPVRGAALVPDAFTADDVRSGGRTRTVRPGGPRPVVLLLPGQGSQYAGMAVEAYRTEPAFRAAVDEVLALWGPGAEAIRADWLAPTPAVPVDDVRRAQPLLFAVDLGLGRLLSSWGVEPAAVIGHSAGEVVAATLAGVLTTAEAVALVRGRVEAAAPIPPGGMIAVAAGAAQLRRYLAGDVAIAAVNASRQTMLAGPTAELDRVAARLVEDGFTLRAVPASTPFHSPAMAPAVAQARRLPAPTPGPARFDVWSCYTGARLTAADAGSAEFWARQIADPVYFGDTLAALLAEGDRLLVEAGPGQTLTAFARRQRAVRTGASAALPLLPGGAVPDDDALLAAAAELWLEGHDLEGMR